jgi:hypothetical protein
MATPAGLSVLLIVSQYSTALTAGFMMSATQSGALAKGKLNVMTYWPACGLE